MGAVAACTSQGEDEGPAGNTNIRLVINGGNVEDEFFTASYIMDCDGADTGIADTPAGELIPDARRYEGNYEVTGDTTPEGQILEIQMDLPLGECTHTIYVMDEDEIICTGTDVITILANTLNIFNVMLVCDVSFQSPVADALVRGTFREILGNFCPSVNIVNTLNRTPDPGVFDVAVEGRAMDIGNTCGGGCDCTSAEGLQEGACDTIPPTTFDIGLVALPCAIPASALTTDPDTNSLIIQNACVNDVGNVGSFAPGGPYIAVADADGNGIIKNDVTYSCDPLQPGATVICWLFSDGDTECAKIACDVRAGAEAFAPVDPTAVFPYSVLCPGDNECDGSKLCPNGNSDCLGFESTCVDGSCTMVVCDDDPNDCVDGGTCTPTTGACDGGGTSNEGDLCSSDGGNVCDADGNCEPCIDSENNGTNPNCDSTAIDCKLPSLCLSNVCEDPRETAPGGTACSNGICGDLGGAEEGECLFQAIDYCGGTSGSGAPDDPDFCTKVISVGCTNSITPDISILEWTLTADPGFILSGEPVTVDYSGVGAFDETFLDAAQSVIEGGVRKAAMNSIAATVVPRTGLTGADAADGVLMGTPDETVVPFTCGSFKVCDTDSTEDGDPCFTDSECTGGLCIFASCNPDNDIEPPSAACNNSGAGPKCGNSGCLFSFGNPSDGDLCRQFVEIPITTDGCLCNDGADSGSDCAGSGNECDTDDLFVIGSSKLETQCDPLGYCVTGGLSLPLESASGNYTAVSGTCFDVDDNPNGSVCNTNADCVLLLGGGATCRIGDDVLIGWEDRLTRIGASVECVDTDPPSDDYPINACEGGAGTWALPLPAKPATATVPPPGIGLRVDAGGLSVGVDCLMGVRAGIDTDGDDILDQSAPTPNTCTQQNVDDGVGCTLGEDLLVTFGIQVP
jgi:hypothetical protein